MQHEFAAAENTLILTIQAWLEGSGAGIPNGNRTVGARALHAELRETASSNGYHYNFPNEVAMGRALGELGEAVEDRFTIGKNRERRGTVYRIQPAGWEDEQRLL